MKRKKKASKSDKSSRAIARLPVEIRRYIKGKVVDLSASSPYYRKHARTVIGRLDDVLTKKDSDRYVLHASFFSFFMDVLCLEVDLHYDLPYINAGDFPAYALFDAGRLFKRVTFTEEEVDVEESDNYLWPHARPISEAWARLGNVNVPMNRSYNFSDPRMMMGLRWERDRQALPKLTIEIKGEPVCLLMKAKQSLQNPVEQLAAQKEAKVIWIALLNKLSLWAEITRVERGRPGKGGRRAAFLHDQKGLSWVRVAKKLCPIRHEHDRKCGDNFRSQAEQFWDHLQSKVHRLPPLQP